MKTKFTKLFKKYAEKIDCGDENCYINENNSGFNFNFSSHYGELDLLFDFDNNSYKVICDMSEDQYCSIFMCDEDDIDDEDLDAWNTSDTYNDPKKAFERFKDIIESIDSECDGCLSDNILELVDININDF